MDKQGKWSLAPAYDITYACDAKNRWLARHQMSINGKTEGFTRDDLLACGRRMNLSGSTMNRVFDEVKAALDSWKDCAEAAFLKEEEADYIQDRFIII